MIIKNKKIVVLGDSITEGVGTSDPAVYSYPVVLGKLSGAIIYNYGVSGTRFAKQTINDNPAFQESFIQRMHRIKEEPDVVLVFGGTNDFGHGDAPFGEDKDRTDDTYVGACHVLFSGLIEKFPKARIVVITPLHRLSENNRVKEVRNIPTVVLEEYVKVQRKVAEYYSLPVIDLYKISGLQPAIPAIQKMYMPDGLHPSDEGAKLIAEIIYAQLQSL